MKQILFNIKFKFKIDHVIVKSSFQLLMGLSGFKETNKKKRAPTTTKKLKSLYFFFKIFKNRLVYVYVYDVNIQKLF